jgi:hypothetical protein
MTELFLAYEQQMNDYDNSQPSLQIPNNKQQQQYEYEKASMQLKQGFQGSQASQESPVHHESPEPPQQIPQPLPQQKQHVKENFQMYQPVQQYRNNGYYQQQQQRYPEYSFWDRMVMSKREVLKLFILSIVIILAISLEKLGSYYMTSYLTSTDLSSLQEFMVRLSFPIIVFLFLWIIKSL